MDSHRREGFGWLPEWRMNEKLYARSEGTCGWSTSATAQGVGLGNQKIKICPS